jgi:hypothetical protein
VSVFVVSPEIEDRDEVEVLRYFPTSHSSFTQYNALKALECMQFPNDYEHAMPH